MAAPTVSPDLPPAAAPSAGPYGERYEARVHRAIALVEQRLDALPGGPRSATRAATLAELADAACLSRFHFHRVFRGIVGETVHDFTTRLRLERALRLARAQARASGAVSWKQVAAACGYRSPAVFTRAFRRHFGCAPSAFDVGDPERVWAARADANDARRVSSYFLRPAPPVPDGFAVSLVERPAARLVVARAWGAYVHPERLLAAYERVTAWAAREGLPVEGGRLAGASRDDPDVTPLARCRYDFVLAVDDAALAERGLVGPRRAGRANGGFPDGLALGRRAAGWWALHAVAGDLPAVDRAWNVLFKAWLPASGLALRDAPAEERYHRTPAVLGWERFDLECAVPVHAPAPVHRPASHPSSSRR